jgi:hypothetical protein
VVVLAAAMSMLAGARASAQERSRAGFRDDDAAIARDVEDHWLQAALHREAIRLADTAVQAASPSRVGWLGRHPVLAGTLIGTGAGAALSQVDAIGGTNHDPRVALIGTGVGAWGGLIASAVHKSRTGEKVGAGIKAGIIAGAAAIVVLPVLACYGAGGCGGAS